MEGACRSIYEQARVVVRSPGERDSIGDESLVYAKNPVAGLQATAASDPSRIDFVQLERGASQRPAHPQPKNLEGIALERLTEIGGHVAGDSCRAIARACDRSRDIEPVPGPAGPRGQTRSGIPNASGRHELPAHRAKRVALADQLAHLRVERRLQHGLDVGARRVGPRRASAHALFIEPETIHPGRAIELVGPAECSVVGGQRSAIAAAWAWTCHGTLLPQFDPLVDARPAQGKINGGLGRSRTLVVDGEVLI